MRILESVVAVTVVFLAAAPLHAQSPGDGVDWTPFAGGNMSRYGPGAVGGLEMAMKRWLALRVDGVVSFQQQPTVPDRHLAALSLSGVVALSSGSRVSPYFFAGYAYSASRHLPPGGGPLGGAGVRFRFGRFQPFVELRSQHRIGIPISLGLRF
jgi:hypothetical protein